ncbi:hypothetical protein Gogos_022045 [Gossypium gossypioides]|uniref:Uncharacterized protein n=1 Tax=Gossypium gossypioides TaxID=34282 RepID=A0A7J9CX12_GOSGO|nr:hypothetical protein [Gossypium gossypioides]
MCFHKEMCEVSERTKGSFLHHEALCYHAYLLA